ncbi:hypothetical protein IT408_01385 [Candidatus Uhrbacteria bacterium]|nr:hypothetical protein [Candidatus Uhrbacteria bacterium]
MQTVSPQGEIESLLRALKPIEKPSVPETSRIRVHAAVSRFSVLYERIRNAVDYKDDHLLRKSAILRILKRQTVLEKDPAIIADQLIRELIGAKYLPNDELDERLILEAEKVVQKLLTIQRVRLGSSKHLEWLQGIIAVELEDLLADGTQEKILTTFLYEKLAAKFRIVGSTITAGDIRLQVYIAVYRTFLKADDFTISYKLIRAFLPEWMRPQDWVQTPQALAERLLGVERRIRLAMDMPETAAIQRAVRPWSISLRTLFTGLKEKPSDAQAIILKTESLEELVVKIANRQYQEAKGKLRRGALRAMVYLFVTKMFIALVLEVPLELLWYKEIFFPALLVNLLFPPVLMFIVSLLIKIPNIENTKKILSQVISLTSHEPMPWIDVRFGQGARSATSDWLFRMIYAATFGMIFGCIVWVLGQLSFTWISTTLFLFFLCVVSFFAFRLRMTAREYVVLPPAQRASTAMLDFISLPILRAGQWLSLGISRINVFLFFFDFLFEAPFKIFLSVLEEWLQFMKEKKEELQ